MYKYLTRSILLVIALSSMGSPLLKADSYSDGVLSIDRVLVGSDIYHDVKVTVKDLIENNGGLAEANFDTYDGETGLLTIPRVEVGNDVYSNLVISLGQAISYESVSAVTTLPTTLADFTADIEHNNCHGLVDPDLTNTNFGVTHPIGSNEWSCDVVTDKTKHPIKSGEKSFRFELRPDECSRNNGFDDCINDRSRTELTSWVPKGANFDQSLLIVEYDIFIPSQTNAFAAGLPLTDLGQIYLKGSEGESLSIAYLFVDAEAGTPAENSPTLTLMVNTELAYNKTRVRSIIGTDFYDQWLTVRFEVFGDTEEGYIKAYVNDELYLDVVCPTLFHKTDFIDTHIGIYRAFLSRVTGTVDPIVVYYDSYSYNLY
ncbi:hypothetical protein N9816_02960 [Gammaproteobacteria bacterium]|nr:hypothetical protein [Gammaproteobacteria bacterium]